MRLRTVARRPRRGGHLRSQSKSFWKALGGLMSQNRTDPVWGRRFDSEAIRTTNHTSRQRRKRIVWGYERHNRVFSSCLSGLSWFKLTPQASKGSGVFDFDQPRTRTRPRPVQVMEPVGFRGTQVLQRTVVHSFLERNQGPTPVFSSLVGAVLLGWRRRRAFTEFARNVARRSACLAPFRLGLELQRISTFTQAHRAGFQLVTHPA